MYKQWTNVSASTRKSMRANKQRNTKPEMVVRRIVYGLGYRYRLHRKELPGTPDIVFQSRRKIIFVHGCFWHGHNCRPIHKTKTRIDYWMKKINNNIFRDSIALESLQKLGWETIVIWECETRNLSLLAERVKLFLES